MKKILVTGSAGFIGYHLSKSLLDDGLEVIGIDNINNYYDQKLKKNRLEILKKNDNFTFHKLDISNYEKLSKIFKKIKPSIVVNLAAQAGVRYSIENPFVYASSNLIGFINIIELSKNYNVENFVYASSSSVYGDNEKIPFNVKDSTDTPISLYGATKKSNELIAHSYSHLFNLNTIGLRFFTVYGPWGRPDMAMYIFCKNISSNKSIKVFNHGNMNRDFTYIDDIVSGIRSSIDKRYKYEIFNLGNSKSEKLLDVIKLIEKELNIKANIEFLPMQPGDVEKTYSDIKKTNKMLDYRPSTNIDVGIKKFIDWYKDYHKI